MTYRNETCCYRARVIFARSGFPARINRRFFFSRILPKKTAIFFSSIRWDPRQRRRHARDNIDLGEICCVPGIVLAAGIRSGSAQTRCYNVDEQKTYGLFEQPRRCNTYASESIELFIFIYLFGSINV